MTQALASFEKSFVAESDDRILCSYINITDQIQVIRRINIPYINWERVVFPGECLMFEAVPMAQLEVHTSKTVTLLISCQQLRVKECFRSLSSDSSNSSTNFTN